MSLCLLHPPHRPQLTVFQRILMSAPGINVYDIRKKCVGPLCYDFSDADAFLNSASVRKELGVGDKSWEECNMIVNAQFWGKYSIQGMVVRYVVYTSTCSLLYSSRLGHCKRKILLNAMHESMDATTYSPALMHWRRSNWLTTLVYNSLVCLNTWCVRHSESVQNTCTILRHCAPCKAHIVTCS